MIHSASWTNDEQEIIMHSGAQITAHENSGGTVRLAVGWRMWIPVVAMMTCSWLSYVDRQALAVISPMILRDTGLSAASYADAISVFSILYMIANPLWGSLLDYVGLRVGNGVLRNWSCL